MKKINFQNNITKVNKETFDEFQNNIEESCVIVSPTEPTTNEKVWMQKGKNLFNRENNILEGYFLSNEGTYETSIGSYVQNYYIVVSPNTEYILWHDKGDVLRVGFFDNNKIFISRQSTSEKNLHFTTPANCKYLIISWDVLETSKDDNNIQLEQGSTATEYEPYIEKKIYCKNDNGVFEEFVNAEGMLTIYEGALKGGESVILSNVKRFLDVYFRLAFGTDDQIIKYTIDTGVPLNLVSSGAITPAFDNENGLEYYISESKYDKSNNTFTHTKTGYFNIKTGTYNSRNGGIGGYEIYRIDTYDK